MRRNTGSLPVIDYPSTLFDVASSENSAMELETRQDQCFYNMAEVCHNCHFFLNEKAEVKDLLPAIRIGLKCVIIYQIYECIPSSPLFIVKLFIGDIFLLELCVIKFVAQERR